MFFPHFGRISVQLEWFVAIKNCQPGITLVLDLPQGLVRTLVEFELEDEDVAGGVFIAPMVKNAIERAQSRTCSSYAEREHFRRSHCFIMSYP